MDSSHKVMVAILTPTYKKWWQFWKGTHEAFMFEVPVKFAKALRDELYEVSGPPTRVLGVDA